jgi:hypothetical protein
LLVTQFDVAAALQGEQDEQCEEVP